VGVLGIANRSGGYEQTLEDYLAPLMTSMAQFIDAQRNDAARLAAEQHVTTMHAQLSAFIEHTPAAVAMFDRKMNFLAHSQRWRRDFGIDAADLIGKSLYEILPDIPALWRESYERALQGDVEGEEGDPYIRSDGSVRWLRWEARPWFQGASEIGGIVLFCEDITDSKRAADALHARDQLLVKLSARIPGMLFQLRFQKTEHRTSLLYASGAALAIYGLSTDELADDPDFIFRICHPDDQLMLNVAITDAAREGGVLSIEHRICVPHKPIRWIHIEAALERLADASSIWHGYVQDITERKRIQAETAEVAARLRLAARAHGLGTWDCVLKTNRLTFDQRMYEIYQTSEKDFPNPWDLWHARIHPDDAERIKQEIRQVRKIASSGGETLVTEFRIQLPSGALHRVRSRSTVDRDANGQPVRIVGVNWDMGLEAELNVPIKTLNVLNSTETTPDTTLDTTLARSISRPDSDADQTATLVG
jgi:PAS domain S-box-containing protein